jgi:hypothetical protein
MNYGKKNSKFKLACRLPAGKQGRQVSNLKI